MFASTTAADKRQFSYQMSQSIHTQSSLVWCSDLTI